MTLVERGTILTRINWTGVIAGLALGAVTQLALSALGVTFGSAYADTAGGLAIGTVLWLAVSVIISAFVAGLVASRAAGYLTPAQGRFNGLVTGALLALLTTLVLSNALTAGFRTATSVVSGAATATAAAGTAAANSGVAQSGPVQALLGGLNEDQIGAVIGQAAPELSDQQATAATKVVSGIVQRAVSDVGANLGNISNLGDVLSSRVAAVTKALQGPDFVSRLQKQGLSQAQATATATAISARATQLRDQAVEAAKTAEQVARRTANTAAWSFLLALGLILGFATLGGGVGSDIPKHGAVIGERPRDDNARP